MFRNRKPFQKNAKSISKPEIINYNEPTIKDMAIILVYFNPCKYRRIIQNALTIKHQFDSARIPYYLAEIKHNSDMQYLFPSGDNVYQYSSNSYMFYKENLIHIVETKIPANYTKICILDFDILFDEPNWYTIVSEKLNSVEVVQPFKNAHYLNLDYSVHEIKTNCVDNKTAESINYNYEHTGFVWAFQRNWYASYDFDDMFITGMGDSIFATNITRRQIREYGCLLYYNYNKSKVQNKTAVRYDSCDLNVYHLNHGALVNRQYSNIHATIYNAFLKYKITDYSEILIRRDDSIIEYTPKYLTIFNDIMLTYFKQRDDDTTTI